MQDKLFIESLVRGVALPKKGTALGKVNEGTPYQYHGAMPHDDDSDAYFSGGRRGGLRRSATPNQLQFDPDTGDDVYPTEPEDDGTVATGSSPTRHIPAGVGHASGYSSDYSGGGQFHNVSGPTGAGGSGQLAKRMQLIKLNKQIRELVSQRDALKAEIGGSGSAPAVGGRAAI